MKARAEFPLFMWYIPVVVEQIEDFPPVRRHMVSLTAKNDGVSLKEKIIGGV